MAGWRTGCIGKCGSDAFLGGTAHIMKGGRPGEREGAGDDRAPLATAQEHIIKRQDAARHLAFFMMASACGGAADTWGASAP